MNSWLLASPSAQIAHGALGCQVSVNDLADRPPRVLRHGEVIDLGSRRVRRIETPHVPHGWDADLLYEETTSTLFCGDPVHGRRRRACVDRARHHRARAGC